MLNAKRTKPEDQGFKTHPYPGDHNREFLDTVILTVLLTSLEFKRHNR